MTEMVRRFLRQKFGSVGVVIALSALSLVAATQIVFTRGGAGLETGGFLALLILAAASVSKDSSSGALQMILARPIRRAEYLFGRYWGILAAYAIYVAVASAIAVAIPPVLAAVLGLRGMSMVSLPDLARGAAGALLSAAFLSALLLFFSTFLRGYGDILAFFLFSLLLNVPDMLQDHVQPWVRKLGGVIRENVMPHVAWGDILRGGQFLSEATGRYALALTAYLALGTWIFSRREFSYGQD